MGVVFMVPAAAVFLYYVRVANEFATLHSLYSSWKSYSILYWRVVATPLTSAVEMCSPRRPTSADLSKQRIARRLRDGS